MVSLIRAEDVAPEHRREAWRRVVTWMRAQPSWPATEALGRTVVYDAAVLGPGNALPSGRLASITAPTLMLSGANSRAWMASAARAVAGTVPGAIHQVLDGQSHSPAPERLAPVLAGFSQAG